MGELERKIICSPRKTLGLEINANGLIFRAPLQATDTEKNQFVLQHKAWLDKRLEKVRANKQVVSPIEKLSMDEIRELADRALIEILKRVQY